MEKKETILIIDDEEIVRRTTRAILERQGYEVLTAEEGTEGLEIVRAEKDRIDMVLLDLSLPGMSGEEMLSELRKVDPRLKITLFTGYFATAENFPEADGVIRKPFTMEELEEQVRAVLEGDGGGERPAGEEG